MLVNSMERVAHHPDIYLATAAELLAAEGMNQAADTLRKSEVSVEETGFDNWNGGTRIWTITLLIGGQEYADLGVSREAIEEQIHNRLEPIVEQFTSDWFSIKIRPKPEQNIEWRDKGGGVPEAVRRNIFDGLRIDDVVWYGRLDDVEFLSRLYDLDRMPSYDSRFKNASGDIWQHRYNNDDWPNDWVYGDERFNLMHCSSDTFLRFLCEIVHPVVRPDRNEALRLIHTFNDQLAPSGWLLVEEEKIAGRPRFVARPSKLTDHRSSTRARSVAEALDASWMQKEIERLENAVETDPALAIGTAKELLETCCKSILLRRNVTIGKNDDLPKLTKALTKELKLVPEGISNEAKGAETIRLLLRNLSTTTKYLSELRNLYGSGHGRDGSYRGLEPRHARLAVGAAVAFIDFVTATYQKHSVIENRN